jgi:hypothetical protein
MSKTSYRFRPPFDAIFREVLYEGYDEKNEQPVDKCEILRFNVWFKIYFKK